MAQAPVRVLAISSAGGHWVQLQRLRSAWDGCDVVYATTKAENKQQVFEDAKERGCSEPRFYQIVEATRWQKFQLLKQLFNIIVIFLKEKPDVVVTTGAAAGYFALKIGKMMGARTIWIDSIANAEEMSLSGQKVYRAADLWLTQWEHLAGKENPDGSKPVFKGAVL